MGKMNMVEGDEAALCPPSLPPFECSRGSHLTPNCSSGAAQCKRDVGVNMYIYRVFKEYSIHLKEYNLMQT